MERKYVLTRIGPGDYLLPSNDAKILWRIVSYEENGSLEEEVAPGKYRKVLGTFWNVWQWKGDLNGGLTEEDIDPVYWSDRWQERSCLHRTRRDAIEDALSAYWNNTT